MLDVITSSFYIKSPDFSREDFELRATELFDEWDRYVEQTLLLPDYSLTLIVEEGSIKGKGKIAAAAAGLYLAITAYGDLFSSLKLIREHAEFVSDALFIHAKQKFDCGKSMGNSKKTSGEIVFLESLFEEVQRGAISSDEAMREVKQRWRNEEIPSKLYSELENGFLEAPKYPEQLELDDSTWEICTDDSANERPRTPKPRAPEPLIPTHLRIEISRPSKGDRKKVKLTKVK